MLKVPNTSCPRVAGLSFLDSNVLCLYLSGEAPPTSYYHGDSPSWISCLLGSKEAFSKLNPVNVCFANFRGIMPIPINSTHSF